jgi:hypothetical protein
MIDEFTAQHHEHISARSFDEVIATFEAAVGSVEDAGIEDDAEAGIWFARRLEGRIFRGAHI